MSTLASVVILDLIANRPAASISGRLFYAVDVGVTYRDNGSLWDVFGDNYGGGITSTRPTLDSGAVGVRYFDTTLGLPIFWNGLNWVNASGATV